MKKAKLSPVLVSGMTVVAAVSLQLASFSAEAASIGVSASAYDECLENGWTDGCQGEDDSSRKYYLGKAVAQAALSAAEEKCVGRDGVPGATVSQNTSCSVDNSPWRKVVGCSARVVIRCEIGS